MDRVVEHRPLEGAEQVFAEGQCQEFVRGEGHIADLEGIEEAVEDVSVALLAHHRKARVHQRVEIAVDSATHAAEVFGQVAQAHAPPASREVLDELPLACELVAAHCG